MKKNILFLFSLSMVSLIQAQQIPNPGFENWTIQSYDNPNGWFTSNPESIGQGGVVTASQVSGFMNSAIRLETKFNGTDTVGAYMSNTNRDPLAGEGGVPYSQQATSITGYYRYSLPVSDTALLLVIFKNGGNIISMDIFKIRGSGNQPSFTPFNFPLSLPGVPDTVIIAAASSNLIDEIGVEPGSWIEFDELAFSGPGVTQGIPNGNFDSWTTMSYDTPDNWSVLATGVSRSMDSYSGTYAARLDNIDRGSGPEPTGISTGFAPYTLLSDSLLGRYKFVSSGNDSVTVYILLYAGGNVVGGNVLYLPAVNNYTPFVFHFVAFMPPDSIQIDFYSSVYPFTHITAGSSLYIDELSLKSSTTGIDNLLNDPKEIIVYPNPFRNFINILNNTSERDAYFRVWNLQGMEIESKEGLQEQINTSEWSSGTYILHIHNQEKDVYYKVVKENR